MALMFRTCDIINYLAEICKYIHFSRLLCVMYSYHMIPSLYLGTVTVLFCRGTLYSSISTSAALCWSTRHADKFHFQISLVCTWRSATRPMYRQGLTRTSYVTKCNYDTPKKHCVNFKTERAERSLIAL